MAICFLSGGFETKTLEVENLAIRPLFNLFRSERSAHRASRHAYNATATALAKFMLETLGSIGMLMQ